MAYNYAQFCNDLINILREQINIIKRVYSANEKEEVERNIYEPISMLQIELDDYKALVNILNVHFLKCNNIAINIANKTISTDVVSCLHYIQKILNNIYFKIVHLLSQKLQCNMIQTSQSTEKLSKDLEISIKNAHDRLNQTKPIRGGGESKLEALIKQFIDYINHFKISIQIQTFKLHTEDDLTELSKIANKESFLKIIITALMIELELKDTEKNTVENSVLLTRQDTSIQSDQNDLSQLSIASTQEQNTCSSISSENQRVNINEYINTILFDLGLKYASKRNYCKNFFYQERIRNKKNKKHTENKIQRLVETRQSRTPGRTPSKNQNKIPKG